MDVTLAPSGRGGGRYGMSLTDHLRNRSRENVREDWGTSADVFDPILSQCAPVARDPSHNSQFLLNIRTDIKTCCYLEGDRSKPTLFKQHDPVSRLQLPDWRPQLWPQVSHRYHPKLLLLYDFNISFIKLLSDCKSTLTPNHL